MTSKTDKPLVLLAIRNDQLQSLLEPLQELADFCYRPDFTNVRDTPLTEENYKNVVVVVLGPEQQVDEDFIDRCPKLRVALRYGIGVNNIDTVYAASVGVCACNIPDYGIEEVADSTLSHILNLFRQTVLFHCLLQSGSCFSSDREVASVGRAARRIRGKTLGLIGMGNIGTAVAIRAKAFGFNVIFFDPYIPLGFDKSHGVERVHSVEELVTKSDCVSLHCVLNAATRHIISESVLKLFKKEAFLVNVSRGALVDERALAEALKEGRIAGAGIDVFENEPFSLKGSVYEDVPNIYLTPHAAWMSAESVRDVAQSCLEYVRLSLVSPDPTGLQNCVNRRQLNPESWKSRWS